MKPLRFSFVLYLLPIFFSVPVASANEAPGKVAIPFVKDLKIPFIPVIEVTVNGKEGRFILDTGAQETFLTPAFQKAAGIEIESTEEGTVGGVHGKKKKTYENLSLDTIRFGKDFTVGPHPASLLDLSHLNRYLKTPLCGILGMNVLAPLNPRFDFPAGQLILNAPAGGEVLPAKLLKTRAYALVTIGGKTLPLVIDTAATTTMVDGRVWPALSKGREVKIAKRTMAGATGSKRYEQHSVVVQELGLGPLVARDVSFIKGPKIVLGLDVLRRYAVTFDYASDQVLLEEPSKEPLSHSAPESVPVADLPAPEDIAGQIRKILPEIVPSNVAIRVPANISGVVISPDGWVLTAAHAMQKKAPNSEVTVVFPDGTEAKARTKGYDLESDFALLKLDGERRDWPHTPLASASVPLGGIVFTLAHPGGHAKERPAQLRVGRVHATKQREDRPWLMIADFVIQPGDSGGGVYNLQGELVGIDSSAVKLPGISRVSAIESFHAIRERLEDDEQGGDFALGPGGSKAFPVKLTRETLGTLQQVLVRRAEEGHRLSKILVQSHTRENGEARIPAAKLIANLPQAMFSVSAGEAFGYGLADPALVSRLPKLPATAPGPLAVLADEKDDKSRKQVALAVHVAPGGFLTKASRLPTDSSVLRIGSGEESVVVKVAGIDEDWDLALLRSDQPVSWPLVVFPEAMPEVVAATPLMGRDVHGLVFWNIATDQARPVPRERATGPVRNPSPISKRRAPFPMVIRHALPLDAADAVTPVYDFEGRFVGLHIARFSRTVGLLIPANIIKNLKILSDGS